MVSQEVSIADYIESAAYMATSEFVYSAGSCSAPCKAPCKSCGGGCYGSKGSKASKGAEAFISERMENIGLVAVVEEVIG
ncbi:hypothetical protein COX97_03765 [Candidatus Pacearchaeota archaeon CG_4_10_14_0_2_um_filter_05_32_18]|nr:MAG: hypothetical protein AUJ62_01110 [Candidatus Pacearchaeota archaeon CG1_02_32_21]PIZ82643.1 MAG: hypothetical protein COX97_03765 [Candidatus Pacearchaeota archaeon CG_4_10_14_0_2_um_filter_05_32_18]